MKKLILITLMSLIIVFGGCNAMNEDSKKSSETGNDKITGLIFNALKYSKAKKWCTTFYFPEGEDTVCGVGLKEEILDPRIRHFEDSYSVEMFKSEYLPDGMKVHFCLREDRLLQYFLTTIWVNGHREIDCFEEKIGFDRSKERRVASDEYTSCHPWDNNQHSRMYLCKTKMKYEEFLRRMKPDQ